MPFSWSHFQSLLPCNFLFKEGVSQMLNLTIRLKRQLNTKPLFKRLYKYNQSLKIKFSRRKTLASGQHNTWGRYHIHLQ